MKKKLALLAGFTLLAGTAIVSPVSADVVGTGTFFSDHCDPKCGPQPTGFATITGTDHQNGTIDITIAPLNGNGLVNAGQTTFTFNLVGNPTITYSGLPTGFTVVGGFGTGNLMENAGAIGQDGFGNFEYGIDYTGANGANNPLFTPLSFTISGAGLSLASFAELSVNPPGDTPAFFALDIISKLGGVNNTGLVDLSGQPTPFSVVPSPIVGAGLPGLMSTLGMLVVLARRRRARA